MKIFSFIFLFFVSLSISGQTEYKNKLAFDTNSFIISPNPFITSTTIEFNLSSNDTASLLVYTMTGQIDTMYFQDSLLNQGFHNYEYKTTNNGIYIVRLTLSGNDYFKKVIKTDSLSSIYTYKLAEDFIIKPNPAKHYVELNFVDNSKREIRFTNQNGQIVLTKETNRKDIKIDINNISAGIYLVLVINGNKTSVNKLFVE